jgi:hypothetical protein
LRYSTHGAFRTFIQVASLCWSSFKAASELPRTPRENTQARLTQHSNRVDPSRASAQGRVCVSSFRGAEAPLFHRRAARGPRPRLIGPFRCPLSGRSASLRADLHPAT